MDLQTKVAQLEGIDATELNGEKVMMNLDKGQYFVLNEVGSRIWDLIQAPKSIGEVVSELLQEYEIDEESCREAVYEFLGSMKDAEIIQVF
ncbi:lasso peptide biosynthesis PqqD family chaperone [Clostridium sp. C8-1-8]|uniref:lasso peptide biosynthesis PqqD family chaperone n=1 Tax=Clostridium sp. C8-1-8 TaxID=2698831 RepID=UPI00136EA4FE|nr:lasso peptide biosynthesis PqqD family chaperone [Clostridium sp. C8-1-8]